MFSCVLFDLLPLLRFFVINLKRRAHNLVGARFVDRRSHDSRFPHSHTHKYSRTQSRTQTRISRAQNDYLSLSLSKRVFAARRYRDHCLFLHFIHLSSFNHLYFPHFFFFIFFFVFPLKFLLFVREAHEYIVHGNINYFIDTCVYTNNRIRVCTRTYTYSISPR